MGISPLFSKATDADAAQVAVPRSVQGYCERVYVFVNVNNPYDQHPLDMTSTVTDGPIEYSETVKPVCSDHLDDKICYL